MFRVPTQPYYQLDIIPKIIEIEKNISQNMLFKYLYYYK